MVRKSIQRKSVAKEPVEEAHQSYVKKADEYLTKAVRALAIHPSDARARIIEVFTPDLYLLDSHYFPIKTRKKCQKLKRIITRKRPLANSKGYIYRGSVEHTMRDSRNSTAAKAAKLIWELHEEVERYLSLKN